MNFPGFIARRILRNNDKKQMSRPIVRIATTGIAVGVVLMLLSVSIVKGFQREIREKVIGFGSHFQVVSNTEGITRDSQRLLFEPAVYNDLKNLKGIRHVQVFATKPGLIETGEALQGVTIKGIGDDFDWSFFDSKLVEGKKWSHDSSGYPYDMIISKYMADRLRLRTGDKAGVYVMNNNADPRQRNFTVSAIYETGLQEYDRQFVFMHINHVRKLSGWGLQAQLLVDSVCLNGRIALGGLAFGGDGIFDYKWNNPAWSYEGPFFISPMQDTTITLIVNDRSETAPDTAMATIDFIDDESAEPCRPYRLIQTTTGGSQDQYIGGYEVLINDFDQLSTMDDKIFRVLPFYLGTQKITDRSADIFAWLKMLDLNVIVIIVLMIVISIVNMTSALLILILERQNMIGTLKALGSADKAVARIFLINAGHIIFKGLVWGNLLAFCLIFLQWKFGLIRLDQENYFVDVVPMALDIKTFLLVDIGSILVCLMFLVIPAQYVSRISPVKAMRFN